MTARLDSALARMDALIADVHADCERESGIIALAPVVPIQRASTSTVIKRCACGRSYTESSWAQLARVGIMSDDGARRMGDVVSFQPGQRVRCIDSSSSNGVLVKGPVYIVAYVDQGLMLEGVEGTWNQIRFEHDRDASKARIEPARPVQYTAKVDAALDAACRDFSKRDWLDLAFAALDQAGLSAATQAELRERLDNFSDSEDSE